MAGRIRWTLISLAFAIVLTAAVVIFSGGPTRAPKTWIVQPGHRIVLRADEVLPDDRYRCPGKGGVIGTPPPGHGVGGSGGFSVETRPDGTVIATCEPGPPGTPEVVPVLGYRQENDPASRNAGSFGRPTHR